MRNKIFPGMRPLLLMVLPLALMAIPRAPFAGPPGKPDDCADRQRAFDVYKEGAKLFANQKYHEANDAFRKVIALCPEMCIAYTSVGSSYAKLGMVDEACCYYRMFLDICPEDLKAPAVNHFLDDYLKQTRNGKCRGDCPKPTVQTPRREKGKEKGPSKSATVEGCDPAATGSGAYGSLSVGISGDWANVYIDGEKIQATPMVSHPIAPGKHFIQLRKKQSTILREWEVQVKPCQKIKLLHQP